MWTLRRCPDCGQGPTPRRRCMLFCATWSFKERGNLTLGMHDFFRFVTSETDMTDGAVLAASRELEGQGLLERDSCTGSVVMVCMAMEVLRILRRSE